MFTDKDLQEAIEAGIFNERNEVTANPTQVIRYFEKWAELKCKETFQNTMGKVGNVHLTPEQLNYMLLINFQDVKPTGL